MNRFMSLLILSFIACSISAQSLEANASYIKKNYSSDYEITIKKHALEEWGEDFSMVVYEINKQADALVELTDEFESDNTNIAFRAVQEWSIEGYKTHNIEQFKKFEVFGLEGLLKMHCDWSMVKYEYDKQVKAKNAF